MNNGTPKERSVWSHVNDVKLKFKHESPEILRISLPSDMFFTWAVVWIELRDVEKANV